MAVVSAQQSKFSWADLEDDTIDVEPEPSVCLQQWRWADIEHGSVTETCSGSRKMRWTDLEDDSVILDTFVPWVHFEPQDAQWALTAPLATIEEERVYNDCCGGNEENESNQSFSDS